MVRQGNECPSTCGAIAAVLHGLCASFTAAWVNLMLFYLHTRAQPLIPNLQDAAALRRLCPGITLERFSCQGFDVSYCNALPSLLTSVMPVRCWDR